MSDQELIREYVQQGSEEAFTALVMRHLNLVYSSARRQVQSDEMAREVTQAVFLDLSSSAKRLRQDTHLASWLYVVTRRTAIDAVRRESRRRKREHIAVEIAAMRSPSSEWSNVEPYLDEAVASLNETDRKAVLLRFFESKTLREIGEALGVSEDGAQKRVSRAIEHLRVYLTQRGITATAAGIAANIAVNAVQAAPAELGAAVSSAVALSRVGIQKAAVLQTAKSLAMTKTQRAVLTAMLATAIGGGIYQQSVIRHQERRIAAFETESMNSDKAMRALQAQRDAALARVSALNSERSTAIDSRSGGKAKFQSAVDPKLRLQILEDLQKRNLLKSNMTFIDADGTLGTAFTELFSLAPSEQQMLQKVITDARQQLAKLMAANATVQNNGTDNVVIRVKSFDGGLAIDDSVMNALANTLGPSRYSAFLALGATQVQQALGNFGAQEETISVTNDSAAPGADSPGYIVVDTLSTPASDGGGNNTMVHKYAFPSFQDVSARWPVTQILPNNF